MSGMNFAPYQDASPEIERALSPPPPSDGARRSKSPMLPGGVRSPPISRPWSPTPRYPAQQTQQLPPPSHFANASPPTGNANGGGYNAQVGGDLEGARFSLEAFQTSLPMRMDYEAMLAYLLLPPAGGVLLLVLEHKSDYVRFHAWQSSMLFTAIFLIHLIFSWSSVLSWIIFAFDLLLIGFLALHAYRDVETLDHYEVPFFGALANRFVDNE